jgi:hypothetical protein
LPALLAILFIGCTQPTDDDGGKTGADKTALATAISNAEAALAAAKDPATVFEWNECIPLTAQPALQYAIDTAQGIKTNAAATQTEVDTAVSDLGYATTTFNAAKISGTKVGEPGDTGPAGGKIFYVDTLDAYPWKYLEAAPADLSVTYAWAFTENLISTQVAIGSGAANTTAILGTDADADAAKASADYSYGGYSDWFLPGKDELGAMYDNKASIGGFSDDYYWSSSEYSGNHAWSQYFSNGAQCSSNKYSADSVRAIRAF